jgi:hypothetical protein
MHDIAVVGSRAYAIDAEIRSRMMVSKTRIAGKGFEFAPALEINFPSSAGPTHGGARVRRRASGHR